MTLSELSFAIVFYLKERGYRYSQISGHKNLIYIEGATYYMGRVTLNTDNPDGWNDLRIILEFSPNGIPFISHIAKATCEPGTSATHSKNAAKNGGVARLQLIQYQNAAMMGFHKNPAHPALVQSATILVHRDANKDQKRTGDPIHPAMGINHHSTKLYFKGEKVGNWSEGCLVGWSWREHLDFIALMKSDPRYIADKSFKWDFTLIDIMKLKNPMV
jgi:hypothetical protein